MLYMINIINHSIRADLLEHAMPTNWHSSSWTIGYLFGRYILREGRETSRIVLGNSKISCKALNGAKLICPMDQINLSWYEKKYFFPINIITPQGATRVLMNKSSFLKRYEMTPQQRAIVKDAFDRNIYIPENIKPVLQILDNQSCLEITKDVLEISNACYVSHAATTLSQAGVGASKNPNTPNKTRTDMIARTVMRHPSRESRELLEKLHQRIKLKLINQSDEGLDWLLLPSFGANMYRGGFANAQRLREFLNRDPKTLRSSRLITGLETLLTAIAYEAIIVPQRTGHHILTMHKLCAQILWMSAPQLGQSYPDKYEHDSYTKKTYFSKTEISGTERAELSDVSDAEEDTPVQQKLERQVFFRTKHNGNTRSWAYVAQLGNVPLRYGVSGTAALNLAAAEWLLSDTDSPITSEELKLLAGVLIVPTYHRADYHSVAEVMVGVQYQVDHHSNKIPEILSPQEALKRGLSLVVEATDPQFRDEAGILSEEIIKSTNPVTYISQKTIKNPSKFTYIPLYH